MDSQLLDRTEATAPLAVAGVTLAVRDLESVARFYREVVGLELIERTPEGALLGAGGIGFLELLHRPDALPRDPAAAGLYHTAFLLPSRADLGRWLAHAASLGARLDGAADHLVSEAVYLHDPEGNGIEIYADRPSAEWRWVDGKVVMANARLDTIGLRALANGPWPGAPAGTRIGHVHLQVGDIAKAKRFYADLLGFEVTREGPQVAFLSTGGYHHHIACNIWESPGAGPRDPSRAGLAFVTLAAANPAITEGIDRRSGASNVAKAGLLDPWDTLIRFTPSA